MKKVTIGVAVAISALLGATAATGGSAERADISAESRISLKIKKDSRGELVVFSGAVSSDQQVCLDERRVRLVGGGETVGKTETGADGTYRFEESLEALEGGSYRASVRPRKLDQGSDTLTCEGDRSERETLKVGKGGKGKPDFKPTNVFDTEVTLDIQRGGQGDQYTPPGKARFFGTVSANKQFCTRNRDVRIHIKGKDHPVSVFVQTDRSGEFEFVRDEPVPGSEYRARAERKIREGDPDRYRKGRKDVCRPGRSNVLVIP